MEVQKPSVGRIVHYVMPPRHEGAPPAVRPAIVVHVWSESGAYPLPLVQLQVFVDGTNDGAEHTSGVAWRTSVRYDPEGAPGTWHWPARA